MKPVLFLFLFIGLCPNRLKSKNQAFCSLIFHIMLLMTFAFRCYCLVRIFSVSNYFSVAEKTMCLILWWFTHSKMKNIRNLIIALEYLRGKVNVRINRRLEKIPKILITGAFFVLCLLPVIRTVLSLFYPHKQRICLRVLLPSAGMMRISIIYLYELADIYTDLTLMYAIPLFYTLYCYLFSLCLHHKGTPGNHRIYEKTVEIFKQLENSFSVIIFLVFAIFLSCFFKLIYVFAYLLKNSLSSALYIYFLRFLLHVVLVISMVLAADKVQQEKFFPDASGVSDMHLKVNGQCIKISCYGKSMNLTGWGMFVVRKPLLLSLAAWLFTYAVIIIQYFYAPSNEA